MGNWPIYGWILAISAATGVLITIGGVIWKSARWTKSVDDAIVAWKSIKDDVAKIREQIAEIFGRLGGPPTYANASPMRLTDLGQSVADELAANDWAAGLVSRLREKVEGKPPYEIEAYSKGYVAKYLHASMKAKVQACAYERGLPRENVDAVLWIVLRDALIAELKSN